MEGWIGLRIAEDVGRAGTRRAGMGIDGAGIDGAVVGGKREDVLLFKVVQETMEVG